MAIYSFNGNDLKMLLQGALELLGQSKEEIDTLNVFPVPDGDTGTNMYNSFVSAVKGAEATQNNHIGDVAQAAAKGCLLGARGNSGVILSQIMQGFAFSLKDKENANANDITRALQAGAELAYNAVMRPVEGTILTVVRKSAEEAETASVRSSDLLRLMVSMLRKAFVALGETPDQLPVLKQAGVVDAGGKGYVVILEGILRALKKASPAAKVSLQAVSDPVLKDNNAFQQALAEVAAEELSNYTYCTELLVKGQDLHLEIIRDVLGPYGDCLMVVGEETLAKVHIHTDHPGVVLESCLKYGILHDIKINNMKEQQKSIADRRQGQSEDKVPNIEGEQHGQVKNYKEFAIVSVTSGPGLRAIMESLGTDIVVAGGQTLNPSTGEILKAIEEAPSEQVIVLPNNKNIILAAEQAGELSQKRVAVVPSRSIPQGLAALFTLKPEDDINTAGKKMAGSLKTVFTGEITRAVRDAHYNELVIQKGDLIGLWEGDLKVAGNELAAVVGELLLNVLEDEGRLITFYYGETIDEIKIKEIVEDLRLKYPRQEFDLQYGGQPVYDLIISVE
ncbi:MAG: DAK2 domain-containing protein [Eubacteriales bacterium]